VVSSPSSSPALSVRPTVSGTKGRGCPARRSTAAQVRPVSRSVPWQTVNLRPANKKSIMKVSEGPEPSNLIAKQAAWQRVGALGLAASGTVRLGSFDGR
jgi:hypothetical protein